MISSLLYSNVFVKYNQCFSDLEFILSLLMDKLKYIIVYLRWLRRNIRAVLQEVCYLF